MEHLYSVAIDSHVSEKISWPINILHVHGTVKIKKQDIQSSMYSISIISFDREKNWNILKH